MIVVWLAPLVALVLAALVVRVLVALTLPLLWVSAQALRAVRQRKAIAELSTDWWPEFERQFHAYDEDVRAHRRKRSRLI